MSKKLAIKGHPTRGKEVIELLEMMGGRNESNMFFGKDLSCIYFIDDYGFIRKVIIENNIHTMRHWQIFTLEEFLEKFPFKIGDFVRIPGYESEVRICKMKWTSFSDIEYLVYRNDNEEWHTAYELLQYNDNPNKTRDCKKCGLHFGSVRCFAIDCPHNTPKSYTVGLKDGKAIDNSVDTSGFMQIGKTVAVCFNTENYENEVELQLGDYEIEVRDGKTYAVLKKPKYPMTYEECCDVLDIQSDWHLTLELNNPAPCDLSVIKEFDYVSKLDPFCKLIICRDAYWKIAGEEMGLDGPWEPDWTSGKPFYCISVSEGIIGKGKWYTDNKILTFPTEEMRDAFYENFKDLIEQCKELL